MEFEVNSKMALEELNKPVRANGTGSLLEIDFQQTEMDLDRIPVGAERQL
jgi:hypothetical protein